MRTRPGSDRQATLCQTNDRKNLLAVSIFLKLGASLKENQKAPDWRWAWIFQTLRS